MSTRRPIHVTYGEFPAAVDIRALQVLEGRLPRRALQLALDWVELRQQERLEDGDPCMDKPTPKAIPPLEQESPPSSRACSSRSGIPGGSRRSASVPGS